MMPKRSWSVVGDGGWNVGGESGKEIVQRTSGRLRNLEMCPIRLEPGVWSQGPELHSG